jgi:hypothetical protein
MLPWKSNKYYILVCVRVVGTRARGRVHALTCTHPYLSSMQHVCAILSPLRFTTLSHKRYDFRKNVTEHKMCFDFLYNFINIISHSKKNLARYCQNVTSTCKVPVILIGF